MRLILYISIIILSTSCSINSFNSIVMIGADREFILNRILYSMEDHYKGSILTFHNDLKSDSLAFTFDHESTPLSGWFLFQDDKCIFQSINMYCSECYEKNIMKIKNDQRFKFSALDGDHLISKDKKTTVHIKDTVEDESCSNIVAKRVGSK